jgi:hypothetical protein
MIAVGKKDLMNVIQNIENKYLSGIWTRGRIIYSDLDLKSRIKRWRVNEEKEYPWKELLSYHSQQNNKQ